MKTTNDIINVIIYSDDKNVGIIQIRREYVQKLAIYSGLEYFFEDSLGYYTCTDGPVLVIWGAQNGRTRIVGLTLDIKELRPESALLRMWEKHKSKVVSVRDVHNAIFEATNQVLN